MAARVSLPDAPFVPVQSPEAMQAEATPVVAHVVPGDAVAPSVHQVSTGVTDPFAFTVWAAVNFSV